MADVDLAKHEKIRRLQELWQIASEEQKPRIREALTRIIPIAKQDLELRAEYNPLEAGLIGAGSEITGLGEGARMIAGKVTGNQPMVQAAQADRAERERMMAPLERARPLATGAGEIAPAAILPGGGSGLLPMRLLAAGATSGAYEGLRSGGDTAAAGVGALAGMAGSELARIGQRTMFGNPDKIGHGVMSSPEHKAMVQEAKDLGITLTPGQRSENPRLLQTESGLSRSPFTSGPFVDIEEKNVGINNRIAREAIGIGGDGPLTDEVLGKAHHKLGDKFESIVGSNQHFPISMDFFRGLDQVRYEHGRGLNRGKKFGKVIDNLEEIGNDQYITVREYQKVSSDLADMARNAKSSEERRNLYKLRDTLDFEFQKEFGHLPELKEVRNQYRILKEIEQSKAVSKGNFRPSIYYNYKRRGGGIVTGDSDIEKAARTGHHFVNPVPNSGTPTAQAIQHFATAGPTGQAMMLGGSGISNMYLKGGPIMRGEGMAGTLTSPIKLPEISDILMYRLGRSAGAGYGRENL